MKSHLSGSSPSLSTVPISTGKQHLLRLLTQIPFQVAPPTRIHRQLNLHLAHLFRQASVKHSTHKPTPTCYQQHTGINGSRRSAISFIHLFQAHAIPCTGRSQQRTARKWQCGRRVAHSNQTIIRREQLQTRSKHRLVRRVQ